MVDTTVNIPRCPPPAASTDEATAGGLPVIDLAATVLLPPSPTPLSSCYAVVTSSSVEASLPVAITELRG